MPEENKVDFMYRALGLSGFIIFLLTGIVSLIFALDVDENVLSLSITSGALLYIAIFCCLWVSSEESKRNYRLREEEPISEVIELDEMADSKGLSTTEDYQKTIELVKRVESIEAAAERASNDESRIVVTVADIHSIDDTTESPSVDSCDRMSTSSSEEPKNLSLSHILPLIGIDESELFPEITIPSSSEDEEET
ncbi:hypothetical protein TNCT_584991 [Trichonephila clavata]|uniref:Transmembrane protein n=1 Tax=Trichonephila clavata TaxID=2740835 RepID=A0A8X6HLP5_TRICU|nr:hypothetical protein TNCT_584991 [Trichonephila clavata]